MKKTRLFTTLLALLATAALVFSCIEFTSIVWPTDPKANSDFEIEVNVHLEPATEHNGRFVLAFLVPKSWKVAENGVEASYSADQVQVNGELITITDEKMTLCNDYPEPTTNLAYNNAMLSKFGVLGNTGPVEWIVIKGSTVVNVNGAGTHPYTTAKAKIKFKTGSNNIKFFSAIATCLDDNGFNDDHKDSTAEYIVSDTQTITVTGGTGNDDFTVLHFVSTTPQTFRYGDYVSIEFVSAIGDTKTDLFNENEVYLNAKCQLKDGREVTAPKPARMEKSGDVLYFKYIYPKSFFGVGEKAEITDMHVWFTSKDGSKKADNDGKYYQVIQAAE